MNCAEELLDSLRALMPEGPEPGSLVGKGVRRGFETYLVLAHDPKRDEFEVEDSRGRKRKVPRAEFYRKQVRVIAEPVVKNFYKPKEA